MILRIQRVVLLLLLTVVLVLHHHLHLFLGTQVAYRKERDASNMLISRQAEWPGRLELGHITRCSSVLTVYWFEGWSALVSDGMWYLYVYGCCHD